MNKSFPILKRFKKIGNDLLTYVGSRYFGPNPDKKFPILKGFNRLARDLYREDYEREIAALKQKVSFLEKKTEGSRADYIVYKSNYISEKESCPYCNSTNLYQEMVDIGVGLIPIQPKECLNCGALENYRYWHFNEDELRESKKEGLKQYFLTLKKIIEDYLSVYTEEEIRLGWSCRNSHPLRDSDKSISEETTDEWFNDDIPF